MLLSRAKTRHLLSVSVWQSLALGCFFFFFSSHLNCCCRPLVLCVCLCVQSISPMGGVTVTSLWGKYIVMCLSRESRRLSQMFSLWGGCSWWPKWNMEGLCVCVCVGRKMKQRTHPCIIFWWISFLPLLVTRWLSRWWRVASFCFSGGR